MLTEEKRQQRTDAPYILKVVKPTTAKKEAIPSSELPEEKKAVIESVPTKFFVMAYKHENQHYKVTLADQTIKGYNTMYFYDGHVELLDRTGKPIQQESSSGGVTSGPTTWQSINWNDFNAKVSKYFTVGEVTNGESRRIPKDNTIKQNIFTLAQELDKVREDWGSSIHVTSWYRPPAVNKEKGGASNSQHLYGKAADIKPVQGDLYKFQDWLDKVAWKNKALGYGAKKGFVHVDLRPGNIRWNY